MGYSMSLHLKKDAPADLIESILFGHEKGSFTGAINTRIGKFEEADGGTIFLDEVGEMSHQLQTKLIRFLQDGSFRRVADENEVKVDVRVICTTQKDLPGMVQEGKFREDLYYRVSEITLAIPPLRQRGHDIIVIAKALLTKFNAEFNSHVQGFSDCAMQAMLQHPWPGNVRELANRVRRGLVLAEGRQIEAVDLGLHGQQAISPPMATLEDYKHRAERQALCDVLNRHSDNLSVAARVLGVSRPTFYRLLHKHQIR